MNDKNAYDMEDALNIPNPVNVEDYKIPWKDLPKYLKKVISKFPKEFKIVEQTDEKICVFYSPASTKNQTGNDQLIYISRHEKEIKLEATNQFNKINSLTEQTQLIKAEETLKIWLKKSINNTIHSSKKRIAKKKKEVNTTPIVVQFIALIIVVIAIIFCLKAC